jgi:hypothetical protein
MCPRQQCTPLLGFGDSLIVAPQHICAVRTIAVSDIHDMGEILSSHESYNIRGKRTLLSEPLSYRSMNAVCNCDRLSRDRLPVEMCE